MKNDSPVLLSSSVVLARGNGGVDVDLSAMQSTSRNWLRITELRVFIDPGEARNASDKQATDFGFMVDVAISVGSEELTSGFIGTPSHPTGERIAYVPAFLLGPRIWRRFSTVLNYNAEFDGHQYANQNAYVWTLPRPLLVPPNTPIKFKVRRTSSIAALDDATLYANSFTVEVAAAGTRLANKPRFSSRAIPHLHGWSPRNDDSLRVESGEAFRNLHKQTLNLTRIIGGTALNRGLCVEPDGATAVRTLVDPTTVQIYDAHNQDVLVSLSPVPLSATNPNAPIPLTSLLLAKTNSVRISDRLEPNQTYRMVTSPVTAAAAGRGGNGIIYLPMLALESFREVPS